MAKKVLGPGDDLEMLCSPDLWPKWPVLPVKRHRGGDVECGLVLDDESYRYDVALINMYNLLNPANRDPEKWPKLRYESFEAMLADGWLVD